MNQSNTSILIFTDLDGTLLDHYTYEYDLARNILDFLALKQIPVIPVSSKTSSELLVLCRDMKLRWGYIAENGAVACMPPTHGFPGVEKKAGSSALRCKEFVDGAKHWQALVGEVGHGFDYLAFSRCSLAQIADLTGLATDVAALAQKREFGEVVHWQDSPKNLDLFLSKLVHRGATVSRGGRFIHVGGDADKGRTMQWVVSTYGSRSGRRPVSIAAGDGLNDIPMLASADISVVVRSPVNAPPTWDAEDSPVHQKIIRTSCCGPDGWRTGMILALAELGVTIA